MATRMNEEMANKKFESISSFDDLDTTTVIDPVTDKAIKDSKNAEKEVEKKMKENEKSAKAVAGKPELDESLFEAMPTPRDTKKNILNKAKTRYQNESMRRRNRRPIKEDIMDNYDMYDVEIEWGSFVGGITETFTVDALDEDDAINQAMEEAYDYLDAEVTDVDDDCYTVIVNFAGYIGYDNEYNEIADNEEDAIEQALDEAKMDLNVIAINGEDYEY